LPWGAGVDSVFLICAGLEEAGAERGLAVPNSGPRTIVLMAGKSLEAKGKLLRSARSIAKRWWRWGF